MTTSPEELLAQQRGVFLLALSKPMMGVILDLDSISPKLKTAVIKWLIAVNQPRLSKGLEPIITLELALKCPIWKSIKPPLISVKLTREKLFGKPKIKTLGKSPKVKSINKG